jgi:hypothetical protein
MAVKKLTDLNSGLGNTGNNGIIMEARWWKHRITHLLV